MAILIDYPNRVIFIPRSDLQLVQSTPTEIRQLDLNALRLEIRDLEDNVAGVVYPVVVRHTQPVSISGVTLARVVEIINDYTITFEDGQYAVNITGGNTNVGDVVNVNQVSVRTSNSAGLTYSKQMEDLAFTDNRVFIDTVDGRSGSQYPRGTAADPVDNLTDALLIIQQRNLPKRLYLRGNLLVESTDDITQFDIMAEDSILASMNVLTGAATDELVVEGVNITGDLNGRIVAKACTTLSNLDDFDGRLINSGLQGVVQLGVSSDQHEFINCYSEQAGAGKPTIDCNEITNLDCYFRNFSGGIRVINFSSGNLTLDLDPGSAELDASCTGGVIVVRGTGGLVDNSGPSCTVIRTGLVEGSMLSDVHKDMGLSQGQSKTYIENSENSVDESVDGITKEVRKVGNVTTITRT